MYPLNARKLGRALIINNAGVELPGAEVDVEALVESYEELGLQVRVERNLDRQVYFLTHRF